MCVPDNNYIMSHVSANVTVGYVRHDTQTCDVFIYVTFIYVTLLIHIRDIPTGTCD